MAESLIRLVGLTASCLRLVEAQLGRASTGTDLPAVTEALDQVQRLRPLVELVELLGGADEGDDDGRYD